MTTSHPNALADQPWPSGGLEVVEACPICGTREKALIYDGLWDNVFFAAPGKWSLWRCRGCRSAYLDPRPTAETIHIAYGNYYTHSGPAAPAETPSSPRRRLQQALLNGYVNVRYGTERSPSLRLGYPLVRLWPRRRRLLDYGLRYLEKAGQKKGRRLLDVGCGNGAFLAIARSAGWDVQGCDFDPTAVAQARSSGFEVREGGPETFADQPHSFDFITLSHVLEHVHDPAEFLLQIRGLLRPGGCLYIDTPNADALGLEQFGGAWRGLEPPRHFAIFNWRSLRDLLVKTGYGPIADKPQPELAAKMWKKSARIAAGLSPYDESSPMPASARVKAPQASEIPGDRTEFVTLIARA